MLEKLALKHSLWIKMAKGICGNTYLGAFEPEDLVSEMYLKLSDYNKELNDYYIYFTIKHIFINWLREENKLQSTELIYNFVTFEEPERITIELPDCITWVEKQILLLRQENSCREIAKQYHLQYKKVNRIELKAKEKLKEWAKTKSMVLEIS